MSASVPGLSSSAGPVGLVDNASENHIRKVPDLLANWPWPRKINDLKDSEVAAEARQWLHSVCPFDVKTQEAFDKCDVDLAASLFLPYGSRDRLRTGIDVMYLGFVTDEYTDVGSALIVQKMVEVCKDAFEDHEKPRPQGEVFIGELTRQVWAHAIVREAEVRATGAAITVDEYLAIRPESVGVRLLYALGDFHLSLPDTVVSHPTVLKLAYTGCKLIAIDNDIVSYNHEQASGHINIVTVVMNQFGLNCDDAIRWLLKLIAELETEYQTLLERVKESAASFGPDVAPVLPGYLEHISNARRAHWSWLFESRLYFGEHGAVIAVEK